MMIWLIYYGVAGLWLIVGSFIVGISGSDNDAFALVVITGLFWPIAFLMLIIAGIMILSYNLGSRCR